MGKEKSQATFLTASVDDRMEKGMVPEIISWPMAVRRQFVIREASIVNRPNNLTLNIEHQAFPLHRYLSLLCTLSFARFTALRPHYPHRSVLASGMMTRSPASQ